MKDTIEANLTVSFPLIKKIFFSFYLTKAELLALTKGDISIVLFVKLDDAFIVTLNAAFGAETTQMQQII